MFRMSTRNPADGDGEKPHDDPETNDNQEKDPGDGDSPEDDGPSGLCVPSATAEGILPDATLRTAAAQKLVTTDEDGITPADLPGVTHRLSRACLRRTARYASSPPRTRRMEIPRWE